MVIKAKTTAKWLCFTTTWLSGNLCWQQRSQCNRKWLHCLFSLNKMSTNTSKCLCRLKRKIKPNLFRGFLFPISSSLFLSDFITWNNVIWPIHLWSRGKQCHISWLLPSRHVTFNVTWLLMSRHVTFNVTWLSMSRHMTLNVASRDLQCRVTWANRMSECDVTWLQWAITKITWSICTVIRPYIGITKITWWSRGVTKLWHDDEPNVEVVCENGFGTITGFRTGRFSWFDAGLKLRNRLLFVKTLTSYRSY